jgi:hypothetical protein
MRLSVNVDGGKYWALERKQTPGRRSMTIGRRTLLAAVPFSLFFASSSQAAPKSAWDGTWSGSWGGQAATSVTIAGNRVVRYEYKGAPAPVGKSKVTPTTVTFGPKDFTVTITKTGDTTASAQYHSAVNGDAAADLTKQ